MGSSLSKKFSAVVLAFDLGIDARFFLNSSNGGGGEPEEEIWQDCHSYLGSDEDFFDLKVLQFFRLKCGFD